MSLNKKFLIGMLGLIFMPGLASAADDIKIATKSYMTRAFTPTKELLAQTNTIITDLITQSNTNTGNIGTLSTDKQNRPATDCEAGKQCLLVKNANNVDAWYPIVDCGETDFLNNLGVYEAITIGGQDYQAVRFCSGAAATALGCNAGEVVQAYHNGIVFIEEIGLNIAEGTNSIVSLPSNITGETGEVQQHLCRVVGYRVKNSDGTLQPRQSVDTNLWIVDDTHGGSDANCYRYMMGNSNDNFVSSYYAAVANICADAAPMATMCLSSDFLASIASGSIRYAGQAASNAWGWVKENGSAQGLCSTLGDCGGAGSHGWVEKFGNGYVYGRARLANIVEDDYRYDYAPGLIKLTGDEPEQTVCLCQVTGYKTSSSAAKQLYPNDVWMIISGHEQGDYYDGYDSDNNFACTRSCARYFGEIAENPGTYFSTIDDLCTANLDNIPTATPLAACNVSERQSCDSSWGTWNRYSCSCTCSRENMTFNASTHQCECVNGYTYNGNGYCVEETQQQSCESESGMALKKQNCQHSGGTWNSDNCTCNCSSKPHSTLNNEGWCACDTGYQADGNYTCVSTDNGCDVIENIIVPGSHIEDGEAWVGVSGVLTGGKACDGRIAGIPDATNAYDPQHSCHENEWVHAYENVAIFGEARMVAINEDTPGDIIQLPNNVQDVNAGGVCVCRATAYANANGNTGSGYLSGTMYDPRVSINTGNKWIIAGRQVSYNEEYTGVQNCITNCAFYTPTSLVEYYDYIGNGCTNVTGTTATACQVANPETTTLDPYITFVNAGVGKKWMTNPTIGFAALSKTGKGTGFCENNNSAYCQAAEGDLTAWAMQVTITDPNKYFNYLGEQVSNPYNGQVVLYGRARCVENSGELAKLQYNQGTLVDLNEVPSNSERGTVCIQNIAGYMRGEKQTTTLRSSYWYATKFESAGACAESCAATTAQEMMTEIGELSEPIGGLCLNNQE